MSYKRVIRSRNRYVIPSFTLFFEHLQLIQSSARVMSFRNVIANAALANVQSFLQKYDKPELVEEYVRAGIIYYGEIPFLYHVFQPTDVPAPKSERGGYKVVSGSCLSFRNSVSLPF